MELKTKNEEEHKWMYFVWKCEIGDDRMRPNGKALTKGCNSINIRKSTKELRKGNDIQDKCRHCESKRGRRLNGGNTSVFYTLEEALEHKEGLE
jgi:hypothetical protein